LFKRAFSENNTRSVVELAVAEIICYGPSGLLGTEKKTT